MRNAVERKKEKIASKDYWDIESWPRKAYYECSFDAPYPLREGERIIVATKDPATIRDLHFRSESYGLQGSFAVYEVEGSWKDYRKRVDELSEIANNRDKFVRKVFLDNLEELLGGIEVPTDCVYPQEEEA